MNKKKYISFTHQDMNKPTEWGQISLLPVKYCILRDITKNRNQEMYMRVTAWMGSQRIDAQTFVPLTKRAQ